MTRSIFSKLMLSHILVILISTLTLGLLMSYLVREHVIASKRQELLSKGVAVISLLEPSIESGKVTEFQTLPIISDLAGATVWLVDKNGTVIAGNPPNRWLRAIQDNHAEMEELFNGQPQTWTRTGRQQVDASVVVALPLSRPNATVALFLYAPIVGINKTIDALQELLIYSLLLGTVTAALFGYGISRSLTRPIADIAKAARHFAQGDYGSRTTATGQDEIGALGRTFNQMAQAIAHTDQNRRDFLANVTHELKTPIASIQALTETILDGLANQPGQQDRYLNTIVAESERISRLIDDLLDLAQLEAGALSVKPQDFDLAEILQLEQAKFNPQLKEKNLTLQFHLPAKVPVLAADPDRLLQVFGNLISNAVRHAPPDSTIHITVKDGSNFVTISISNQGSGIPPEELPYIWDRFYRVEKSRDRNQGGTGLGLTITQKLVQAMGGKIDVISTPGQNTTFWFTLPKRQ